MKILIEIYLFNIVNIFLFYYLEGYSVSTSLCTSSFIIVLRSQEIFLNYLILVINRHFIIIVKIEILELSFSIRKYDFLT